MKADYESAMAGLSDGPVKDVDDTEEEDAPKRDPEAVLSELRAKIDELEASI